ncbi:MAG: glycosyltransferase family 2 protein [Pseudomonadota bacterium]
MTLPNVSAIVVSYQTGPRLKECLYALATDPEVSEIILVDNGNPPPMQAWLDQFGRRHSHLTLLRGHGNIGFGAGVNRGAATAMHPDLLVLNPDAALRRGSVRGLQETAQMMRSPALVGGKIFDLFGREERGSRRRELTLWRAVTNMLGWNTWTLEHLPPPNQPVDMPVISGAFFLISKTDFERIGGFDQAYFLHVEDIDLCRRCREVGGQVMYDPRAAALHFGSTSQASSRVVAGHKADSLAYYFRKNAKNPLSRVLVELALPMMRAGIWLKAR